MAVTTAYQYLATGVVSQITYAGTQVTTYTYDALDRQETETIPGNRTTETDYDKNSNVVKVTDPKGQVIESDYDRVNRKSESRHRVSDGGAIEETRTYTYFDSGKLQTVTDLNGSSTYAYDSQYRVTVETRTNTGQTAYTVNSDYNALGSRTQVTYPDGRVIVSSYDPLNRLDFMTEGSKVTDFDHDKNGNRLLRQLPNGIRDVYTYDAINRVTSQTTGKQGSPTIYSLTYGYGLANNKRTVTEVSLGADSVTTTRKLSYGYDARYQLTSETWNDASDQLVKKWEYAYAITGNRTSMAITEGGSTTTTTYAYDTDGRNELLTSTTNSIATTYGYDVNGNRTSKQVGTATATAYIWDVNDRMVSADVDADGTADFEAKYDYRTRRTYKKGKKRDLTADESFFRYDGGVSFDELDPSTSAQKVTMSRGGGMGGGIGSVLYNVRGTTTEYFTNNAVGHTVALTTDTAAVSKTDLYEAFGSIVTSAGTSDNSCLANTKERDFSIGLDNHGFRYFDPLVGRYISRDLIGYGDGMNVYLYVHGNPINYIDPEGLGDAPVAAPAKPPVLINRASVLADQAAAQRAGQAGLSTMKPGVGSITPQAGRMYTPNPSRRSPLSHNPAFGPLSMLGYKSMPSWMPATSGSRGAPGMEPGFVRGPEGDALPSPGMGHSNDYYNLSPEDRFKLSMRGGSDEKINEMQYFMNRLARARAKRARERAQERANQGEQGPTSDSNPEASSNVDTSSSSASGSSTPNAGSGGSQGGNNGNGNGGGDSTTTGDDGSDDDERRKAQLEEFEKLPDKVKRTIIKNKLPITGDVTFRPKLKYKRGKAEIHKEIVRYRRHGKTQEMRGWVDKDGRVWTGPDPAHGKYPKHYDIQPFKDEPKRRIGLDGTEIPD